jgi:glyoxylase-like metal-dependent hydrolase (beta-lactamase superfamily II)
MTLEGTNTYLYGFDPCVVIDPGPDDAGHLDAVRAAAEERGGIGLVLLTHSHGDHAAGADRLGRDAVRPGGGEEHDGLRAIATPGHAADHVCFLTGDGVCFSGDLVLGEGSTFVPLICPGHGPWVTDPAAKLAEYVEHREMRERRLLAALERGERSKEVLLNEAWADVPVELRPAAGLVMEAHLQKLETEGRLPDGVS